MSTVTIKHAALVLLLVGSSGFTLVPRDEVAQAGASGLRATLDAGQLFGQNIVPYARAHAAPLTEVARAIDENFDAACQRYGRQASQAFPCSFWVHAQGSIESIDSGSRVGKAPLVDTGVEDKPVALLVGPVIPGTAVRDAFPELSYDDFGDQGAFARFSSALNDQVRAVIEARGPLEVGQQLSFNAVFSAWDGSDAAFELIPVEFDPSPATDGAAAP